MTSDNLAREIANEYYSEPVRSKSELAEIIAEKIKPLVEDAKRYRYIKDKCVRFDPEADGKSFWYFRQTVGLAVTFDEVIDKKRGDQ